MAPPGINRRVRRDPFVARRGARRVARDRDLCGPGAAMKCQACGKQLATGPGVYLPPIKLRIFEIIRRAGRDGITRAELLSEYGEGLHDACRRVRPPITLKTISAHVIQ